MTTTIEVDELATRLPEMLAEVEAGHEVVLARGAKLIARVKKEPELSNPEEIATAIAEIKEIRRGMPPTTIDEILAWRDEGRR